MLLWQQAVRQRTKRTLANCAVLHLEKLKGLKFLSHFIRFSGF
jgi:hypothetical protein